MSAVLTAILFAALGAIFGSFTGVIAERIHTGQSWSKGRSRCNSCRRELAVVDLIPIVSWTLYAGRCRRCRSRIPAAYTLFELSMAVVFAAAYVSFGLSWHLLILLPFCVLLGFIVLYDLRHTIVPFSSSIALVLLSAAYAVSAATNLHIFLMGLFIAACIGFSFFLLYALSRGRAMGLGDTPMAFALSLLAGPQQAIAGLLFSFWIGAGVGIVLLVLQRGRTTMKSEIPFVPFLAIGYLLAFFTGWNPIAPIF